MPLPGMMVLMEPTAQMQMTTTTTMAWTMDWTMTMKMPTTMKILSSPGIYLATQLPISLNVKIPSQIAIGTTELVCQWHAQMKIRGFYLHAENALVMRARTAM